jgi:hypothetical protein
MSKEDVAKDLEYLNWYWENNQIGSTGLSSPLLALETEEQGFLIHVKDPVSRLKGIAILIITFLLQLLGYIKKACKLQHD